MTDLLSLLPPVRGTLTPGFDLSRLSWLRVGGPAEVLFQPADADDLAAFLAGCPAEIPVFPIGVCSNMIIRSGGIAGVVVRLGRGFNGIEVKGDQVIAGAAALDAYVARKAAAAGVDLTFLRTIPGAIGGAVRMNAGCYGSYMADVVEAVHGVTRDGAALTLTGAECGFAYRSSRLPDGFIITHTSLRGPMGAPEALEARMADQLAKRDATQPIKDRSCGSTFRNPAGYSSTGQADDRHDLKAWKVIDDAGCRGLTRGGAQMSPKHPNFLVNTGEATPEDLEGLGEDVRARVRAHSGIDLTWEILRVGVPKP
ncbi:UDP-N-acetylmuramate dehydrogenase [Rubricella aquisinus]|uniref:UDP-N-acetylenolpyruvoylglucosamine reductase n=1 Tax=Rubricella aquisinus TaxID=2028108 RepID=A0A840WY19_9RHOB|nr:UDP-N-acetylmuramate dehydrogenase [Rubricella aquisinus]MBB5516060.1 UDP-N-acetylmuramate dehydrogenase [Rubricella aquisinus]